MSETNMIQPTGTATAATTVSSAKGILGKDDFLKMMIAQLKHQDPLNPMDGTAFTAQLAQFSSLEQLQNMNTQLTSFTKQQQSLGSTQAVNLIGKEVLARGNTFSANGSPVTLRYNLAGNAAGSQVRIYDANGLMVDSFTLGSQKKGLNEITWNCPNSANGIYSFDVASTDSTGKAVGADTMLQGEVTGVSFRDGVTYVSVGGREIGFSDIVSVRKSGTNG